MLFFFNVPVVFITGIQQLKANDNIEFFWSLDCSQPELEVGRKYYIIGKDGYIISTPNGKKRRYSLMLPTLIVERPTRKLIRLSRVMRIYERLVLSRGCHV